MCNQSKNFERHVWHFCFFILKVFLESGVCSILHSASQFGLAAVQVLNSHTWPMATLQTVQM